MQKPNKKIYILTSVHSVFDTRIFYKQAKTLAKAGYNVVLVAQSDKNTIIDGVEIIALPRPKNRLQRFLKLDYLVYKKALRERADIYHFHDPELIPWMIILKLRAKPKIIFDVHENIPEQILSKEWLNPLFRYIINYIYRALEKISCLVFDHIILASDDIKIKTSKKTVIRNYPFKDLMNLDNINKDYSEFIYIGTIARERCIKEILESLNYVKKSIKLFIIGSCRDEKYIDELKRIAEKQKKHQIIFSDHISYKNVLDKLQPCIAGFILLKPNPNNITAVSRNNKLYEYMSCAVAVIVSNFPLWKNFVKENKCGIDANPLNPKEIARVIEYLVEHPREAERMGKNGRRAILKKYNWENESKKLLKIYEKFAKE